MQGVQSSAFMGDSPAAASQCLGAHPVTQPAAHAPSVRYTQNCNKVFTVSAHEETIPLSETAHSPSLREN